MKHHAFVALVFYFQLPPARVVDNPGAGRAAYRDEPAFAEKARVLRARDAEGRDNRCQITDDRVVAAGRLGY